VIEYSILYQAGVSRCLPLLYLTTEDMLFKYYMMDKVKKPCTTHFTHHWCMFVSFKIFIMRHYIHQ